MKYPNQTIQIKIETIKLVPLDSSIYEAGFWDWYSTENFPLSNTDSVKLRESLNHPYSTERERERERRGGGGSKTFVWFLRKENICILFFSLFNNYYFPEQKIKGKRKVIQVAQRSKKEINTYTKLQNEVRLQLISLYCVTTNNSTKTKQKNQQEPLKSSCPQPNIKLHHKNSERACRGWSQYTFTVGLASVCPFGVGAALWSPDWWQQAPQHILQLHRRWTLRLDRPPLFQWGIESSPSSLCWAAPLCPSSAFLSFGARISRWCCPPHWSHCLPFELPYL